MPGSAVSPRLSTPVRPSPAAACPGRREGRRGETMTRAVKAIDRFEPRGCGFEGWLFGICRHVVADQHRAAGRRPAKPSTEPTDRRRPTGAAAGRGGRRRAAFAKLNQADRSRWSCGSWPA